MQDATLFKGAGADMAKLMVQHGTSSFLDAAGFGAFAGGVLIVNNMRMLLLHVDMILCLRQY